MARLSALNPTVAPEDLASINITRMLARLHQTLITPASGTEVRLRVCGAERAKVGVNLAYARDLLLRLEQDAQAIKIQSKKQEAQMELVRKRQMLEKFAERLQELNDLGEYEDSSEEEDLLGVGEETPSSEGSFEHEDPSSCIQEVLSSSPDIASSPTKSTPVPVISQSSHSLIPTSSREPEFNLRARHKDNRAGLLTPSATTTSVSTTAQSLLTHNRTEQENLTNSLLQMASSLKTSSQAFSSSLEEEKAILNNATKGLERNELGLEAAHRRLGLLRTMTEGKGWWGRMFMYAWIVGLWVVAILVVFVMPKLRL